MHFLQSDNFKAFNQKGAGVFPFPASISFGEEIPMNKRGRVQVNNNKAVHTVNDKNQLLFMLDRANVPVPEPYHPYTKFHDGRAFDYDEFDRTFTYPVMFRDKQSSHLIVDRTELLSFLKKKSSMKFTIYTVSMEEFNTARITVCPLLQETTITLANHKKIERGIINVDLSGPTPTFQSAMIQEAHKACLAINVDLGTVEMLYDSNGKFMVDNISLAPVGDVDLYLKHVVGYKALQGRR